MQAELPKGCALIPLTIKGDERGNLIAIEECREFPFKIARVYFLYGTNDGVTRGLHAHRKLNQFAVPVAGSCDMLVDDGLRRMSIKLDDPAAGLLLPPMVWREMSNFSNDCVLMVVADAPYDHSDYIRDYDEFVMEARQLAK